MMNAAGSLVLSPEVVASSAGRSPATTADLAYAVGTIDRAIADRPASDRPLINYWYYLLFLSWATLGGYPVVLLIRRIRRIDRFSQRRAPYYEAVLDWTDRYAQQCGRSDADLHDLLIEARAEVRAAYAGPLRPINARRSVPLLLCTLGGFGFVVLYRMNRYWWDAQVTERKFNDRVSRAWAGLGLLQNPITFQPDRRGRRGYRAWLLLSILTLGVWAVVWDHRLHTDPDHRYAEFHSAEDAVARVVHSS
ncbi:MAG TPA: hypothetical protein VMU51_05040 [Mycobacteriales bacterium]|nr:hypothetical protein [Mycobacteriales bacterium]